MILLCGSTALADDNNVLGSVIKKDFERQNLYVSLEGDTKVYDLDNVLGNDNGKLIWAPPGNCTRTCLICFVSDNRKLYAKCLDKEGCLNNTYIDLWERFGKGYDSRYLKIWIQKK